MFSASPQIPPHTWPVHLPVSLLTQEEKETVATIIAKAITCVRLTPREGDVARGLLAGLQDKEIAETVGITHKTVKNHVFNIYKKFSVTSRATLFSKIFELR